jgi:predicted dehydrogenase
MPQTRRTFLRTSAAAALAFPALVRGRNLNSKLQVAAIGCDGKGGDDLRQVGSHAAVRFVGFCDVDAARFAKADEKFPGVPHFADFRAMFAELGDTCDAAVVGTPDHLHAPVSLAALREKRHVYCEKPLTHTVWEARQMRLAAERAGVATQMGNQIHSATQYRSAVQALRAGVIGKIHAVHAWQGNRGNQFTGLTARPAAQGTPPATLDWDLWLGPAPFREYAEKVYHPFQWRDWQDFGGGTLGDFGCHILDPVFSALDLTAPRTIHAENTGLNPETWPQAETIAFVFPGTAFTAAPELAVTWYDGGRRPDRALAQMPEEAKLPGGGSLFLGEGGVLVLPHVGDAQLYPKEKFAEVKIEKLPSLNHYHAWVDAALAGTRTSDSFSYAGPLTETVQLGNVATRVPGKRLEWDAAALRITNDEAANRLVTKAYRPGWEPAPA